MRQHLKNRVKRNKRKLERDSGPFIRVNLDGKPTEESMAEAAEGMRKYLAEFDHKAKKILVESTGPSHCVGRT